MSDYKDASAWLEWARAKYDAAQERYAWSERGDSRTMDSYAELIGAIERGMSRRESGAVDADEFPALTRLANQMEILGKGGFAFKPADMVEAARTIKREIGVAE